jgi:hypothetical protein
MFLWCARLTWALLPIATGDALADALDGWATAPAFVAAIFLWAAWAIGLVALLAPRPWGETALRVAGPSAVVVTVLAAPSAGAVSAALGITAAVVAAGFALSAPVARAAGNALAYGDESRFPLRIPPALKYSLVPVAVVVVSVGVTAGPLLLADQRYILGGIALIIGLPAAAFFARSLHALSRRWLVLVPAGVVVVDPLILLDPTLIRREQVLRIGPVRKERPADALDLRLGTTGTTLLMMMREPITFARREGRTGGVPRGATEVLVAPVGIDELLQLAADRRIPT